MKQATLCILTKPGQILLGMKKRGFGVGKYNGFGGKVNPSETIEHAAIRELQEEVGVTAKGMKKVGELAFHFSPEKSDWNQIVHVYLIESWEGNPAESEEMTAEWFNVDKIPYDNMWSDDMHWLPHVLEGNYVEGRFVFGQDSSTIVDMDLKHRPL
jgi:mutator protein MutT